MIDLQRLRENFFPVVAAGALVRAADELAEKTIYSHFLLPDGETDAVPFVVSDDIVDDPFARQLLEAARGHRPKGLEKIAFHENSYGFSHLILVAPAYHSELKGRLDAERASTVLVVPIFEPEFSGTETVEEFTTLRREVVPANRWDRTVHPKIRLRFDNAPSGSGTGDDYVFVTFQQLMSEVGNLMGTSDGFIEVINYKDEVIEIVYAQDELYSVIHDRDDNNAVYANFDETGDAIWAMLNA
ncbi:hypothetical protein [Sphingomonas sp. S2-65]|uniref:hypothetical protein n=1 Tax=Sphingomonas sp. S2-65 TaxID=2903960 RepID=UPI001F1DB1EC|nr:hypothetical protein [Sphingomonas sp. S2-65]UYY57245.1 hypothetical protein LZ586_11160 [Sphingomonas sp. S2-65]